MAGSDTPGTPPGTRPEGDAGRVDPSRCPLCGGPNGCAMEAQRATGQPQPPCWCTRVDFSAELLGRVPEAARNQACICARCAGTA